MLAGWLRSQLLAQARAALPQRCAIAALAQQPDAFGGAEEVAEVIADGVPCRLNRVGARTRSGIEDAGSQETLAEEYELAVPHDAPLAVDQQVTVDEVAYRVIRLETALTDRLFRHAVIVRRT
jgi:hypothetical protein